MKRYEISADRDIAVMFMVGARTKLIITLSDGRPNDQDGCRATYGIEDTRKVQFEARNSSIHPN